MTQNAHQLSTTANHANFDFALACVRAGTNPLMVGPAGCGKTSIARRAAETMGIDFYYTGAVESAFMLRGFRDAHGHVEETSFVKAYKRGGLFLFDEIDASDPAALVSIHAALDNGLFDTPAGVIHRHADFSFMGAANTWGNGATLEYMGRNHLDGATLDRFITIPMDYDEAFERALVAEKHPQQTKWAEIVIAARAAVRELDVKHVVSTRAHLQGAQLLDANIDLQRVKESVLWRGLPADTKVKLEAGLARKLQSAPQPQPRPTQVSARAKTPVTMPAATPSALLPRPTAPATAFTDTRVLGQYYKDKGGIYMGEWQPIYSNGQLAPIVCELYADAEDLGGLHTYNDTVDLVANLDRNGRKGRHFENSDAIIAALIDGSGVGKFFIPASEIVCGKAYNTEGEFVDIPQYAGRNMVALKDTGDFADKFIMATSDIYGFSDWYWSSTEQRDSPNYVWNVRLSVGSNFGNTKDNFRLSSRPCFVGSVRHLTIPNAKPPAMPEEP